MSYRLASVVAILALTQWSAALAVDPDRRFGSYSIDRYSLEVGLPQISALSIVQDSTGYVWVGTQSYLSRFDGVNFRVYDRTLTGGIDTSFTDQAFKDATGVLWFGGRRVNYRVVKGEFERVIVPADTTLRGFAEVAGMGVVASSSKGLLVASNNRFEFSTRYAKPAFALLAEQDGVWIGSTGVVDYVGARKLAALALPADKKDANVTALAADRGRLWIGTSQGLFVANEGRVEPVALESMGAASAVLALRVDGQHNLWVSTVARLYRIRPDLSVETISDVDLVRTPWITALLEDFEGNLWLGSQTESLFRVSSGWAELKILPDAVERLTWCVARDPQNGALVVGNNDGLIWLQDDQVIRQIKGSELPNPAVYTTLFARNGALLIGTRGGLSVLERNALAPRLIDGFADVQINAMVERAAGEFFLGTTRGLYLLKGSSVQRLDQGLSSLAQQFRALLVAPDGKLYAGSEEGLFVYSGERLGRADLGLKLDDEFVTTITQIGPALVIGTYSNGLYLHTQRRSWRVGASAGLPNDNVWSVIDGRDGFVYMTSATGAYRTTLREFLNPLATRQPVQLLLSMSSTQRGSQQARCCNGGGHGRALKVGNAIWYTTVVGPLRLDLAAIHPNLTPPRVVLESIVQGHYSHPLSGPLQFSEPRDVEIKYTALSFRDPLAVEFEYRLEPGQAGWRSNGARRSVNFANLKPDRYTFSLRAKNESQVLSETVEVLKFEILPRWFETSLARALAALLVLGLFALVVWRRQRLSAVREGALAELVTKRTAQLERLNQKLRLSNEALAQDSQTDLLTGLNNRRFFYRQIAQRIGALKQQRDSSNEDLCIGIFMLDLDRFKRINDRYGHAAGDVVLREFALRLTALKRDSEDLVRWGGEEFLLLSTPQPRAKLRERALELNDLLGFNWPAPKPHAVVERLTSSIGFSTTPLGAEDSSKYWDRALEFADQALLLAKSEGRDRVCGVVQADPSRDLGELLSHSFDELLEQGILRKT